MTHTQIRIIRALLDGIPLSDAPFDEISARAGVSSDDLLAQLRDWQSDGTIRRFGAILRHHRAGYNSNTMAVWNVPEDQVERFAKAAVSFRNVSHCYERPRFGGFSFNLYTMIHGRTKDDCESTAREIADLSGIENYTLLYTTKEYKKSSPVYFTSVDCDLR